MSWRHTRAATHRHGAAGNISRDFVRCGIYATPFMRPRTSPAPLDLNGATSSLSLVSDQSASWVSETGSDSALPVAGVRHHLHLIGRMSADALDRLGNYRSGAGC